MKENSKILVILNSIFIFLFIIVLGFFIYSQFNISNLEKYEIENNELNNKLIELSKKIEENKNELDLKEVELNNKSEEFKGKYGYNYLDKEEDIIKEEVNNLISNNKIIVNDIEALIKEYKDYYSGDYYTSKSLDSLITNFSNLNSLEHTNSLNVNLYDELNLKSFINSAKNSGTIKYLSSINKDSTYNDILYFSTILYSQEFFEVGNDLSNISDNFNKLLSNIESLYGIYKNLEDNGVNVGKLSSNNLSILKFKLNDYVKEYYMNKGIIEVLEEIIK